MYRHPKHKTKLVLLGVVVAVLSVTAHTGSNGLGGILGLFATTAKTVSSLGAEQAFQLEKLATFKKLAKAADQNIEFPGNSYYASDVLRSENRNEKEYIVVF